MSRSAILELGRVHHTVSESFTLRVDQLSIQQGETLCLVGPTGAGKSTLLRLLSGLLKPTAGELSYDGQSMGHESVSLDVIRRIMTAHQTPLLLSDSVRANVEYGLRIRRVTDAHDRADRVLQRLGLSSIANQDARTLSGGQKQLVGIGRALAVESEVLLLDEPTSHLDPAHVALVESVVNEQKQRVGGTVVWVTHNLFQAQRMGTRAGLMLQGELIEVAPVETFFRCPSDSRTADFIQGKMVY